MDPLSQAVLGASFSQSFAKVKAENDSQKFQNSGTKLDQLKIALVCGALSGMAPDLDVLIRSSADPLLFLEYHRQFTHSLFFVPFGAAICASVFWLFLKRRITYKTVYFYSFLGYATHALLDAGTSYGTLLFWPFTSERIAWNLISVVDPLITVPILMMVVYATIKRRPIYSQLAVTWLVLYCVLGAIQHDRAVNEAYRIASERGHISAFIKEQEGEVVGISAKPSFGNILVWKTIYEHEDQYFVDAVYAGVDTIFYPGTSVAKLKIEREFPSLAIDSQQYIDIQRFLWFSQGYLAVRSEDPSLIIDMRYSMIPNDAEGLWGIRIDEAANKASHIKWEVERNITAQRRAIFWAMLQGKKIP